MKFKPGFLAPKKQTASAMGPTGDKPVEVEGEEILTRMALMEFFVAFW